MGKKFLIFIILILLAGNWIREKLKDKEIGHLNLSKKAFKNVQKEKKLVSRKTGLPPQFRVGACLQRDTNSFHGVKIVHIEPDIYGIQTCVKYKGCKGEVKQISWEQFHRDYIIHKTIKCP